MPRIYTRTHLHSHSIPMPTRQQQPLQNKRLILGITGGIAAYKSPDVARRLKDLGADVKVVMTRGAGEFITPLTLQSVSGNRVHSDLLDVEAEAAMGHIELARWADAIIVAPATADALARFAQGRADDLLTTLLRASDAPVLIAPAMNQAMWRDAATQDNCSVLSQRAYQFIGPEEGIQACGDTGVGRMSEPAAIALAAASLFESEALADQHVVITAGPTREALDPVRYLSNNSSGKMGFAIAQAAIEAGAKVTIVAGPVDLPVPDRANCIEVLTALDMLEAVSNLLPTTDIFIACAAVADFRPVNPASQKIKKVEDKDGMILELVKNPDILATVAMSADAPFTVGFAAETNDLVANAQEKMERKKIDMMVANDVSRSDIGFGSEANEVTIFVRGQQIDIAKCSKAHLARQLMQLIINQRVQVKN